MPALLTAALIALLAGGIGVVSLPWGSWFKSPPKGLKICVPNVNGTGPVCSYVTVSTYTTTYGR